jgi:FMN phosphatase YigB (HAD superfamily)
MSDGYATIVTREKENQMQPLNNLGKNGTHTHPQYPKRAPKPTIYFDLDGTLYDLYSMPNWLERITTLADATTYASEDALLVDMVRLHEVLYTLIDKGYSVGVVSWLAGGASSDYDKAVRKVKKEWIKKFLPMATEIHIVKYGTPKHRIINQREDAILVDDNAEVREMWNHGAVIDATEDLIEALERLV